MPRLLLTGPARTDIARLLDSSAEHFAAAGRRRYEALVETALRDIATDPRRQPGGTGSRPGRPIYHLRLSRDGAKGRHGSVRSPRHILVYRVLDEEDLVVVLRVLHDAMDLVRHVQPKGGEEEL